MRRARLLAFGIVVAGSNLAHAAVGDYVGKPIASVRLQSEGRDVTDPSLTEIVETHSGEPLSMTEVRESVSRLFSLGRFEDVRVDAALEGGRVALRYELRPIHPVTKIVFKGQLNAAGIDVGQLRRAVVDRYGTSPSLGRAADLARTVEEALNENGFLHPRVTLGAELAHDPDRATLLCTIDPGARTTIASVVLIGQPSVKPEELLKELHLMTGLPYERDALKQRVDKFIEGRRRHGYYEAKVTTTVELTNNDRTANLTVTVDPGPLVRVVFAGDPLPADKRAELVPIEREGSADEDLLEDSSNRIEAYLRTLGYRDAAAPHTREASNGELFVRFNVKKGVPYRIAHLEISGNSSVPPADFAPALRVHDGDAFSETKLDADVGAIQETYHRRGFPRARAQSAVIVPPSGEVFAGAVPVTVRIAITEGVRTLVGRIVLTGNAGVPEAQLRSRLRLQPGTPFFESQLAADRDLLLQTYLNLGYESATIEAAANLSADGARAEPVFTVHEGPRVFVGHVLIVGNVRTSAAIIERALSIKPGDPLSTSAVAESQSRLAALGLFRRTTINELRHAAETTHDLIVTVEEAPPTTVGYGGGIEVSTIPVANPGGLATERLDFAPRASFELGRRNLFGKNRSVNFFASGALHQTDTPTEYRFLGTYREPRLLDTPADAFVNGTIEQQHRSSFDFRRQSATAEVARHLTRAFSVSGSYQIQKTEAFNQKSNADLLLIDRVFSNVRLSSFIGSFIWDTRSDLVDPVSGQYFSATGQLAGRHIGSEVGFAKSFFTAQTFRVLPHTNRTVFAGDARLGLATGFPQIDQSGATIRDLPQSERFYAGGDTTVRGFALDTLGVRHTPPSPSDTIDQNGFPRGGNAVVILMAELRAPVRGNFGVVGFMDGGNVFARAADLDFGALRGALGFGVRYKSPIGPLRVDLGFKMHRETFGAGQRESLTALHISLGQAF